MQTPKVQNFEVDDQRGSATLAAALRAWLPGQSWSQIKKLVATRRVKVNEVLCLNAARRLASGDKVEVARDADKPVPREESIELRYVDPHVVVVVKPAGINSVRHPEEERWSDTRKQLQPTLAELLPWRLSEESGEYSRRGVPPPVRPVHRLDRETSGLMIFARSVDAERNLGVQFKHHTIGRKYLAIVQGHVDAQRIESRLVRDRGDGRRGSTKQPHLGKHAVTHINPLESLNGFTLIECRLETGRTHQIRIHLSELGHPVCGDKVYHVPMFGAKVADKSGAQRLALHAAELGFDHPITGQRLQYSIDPPSDFQSLLERLRRQK